MVAALPLGEFEQIVLLAVMRAGDGATGTRILEELRSTGGRTVSRGALYVTLARLEEKGLLTSRTGEASPVRGGWPRRYVKVSASGLRALRASRATLLRLWSGLEAALGKAE
jgi:DNA-binding PadR family transcriptional regulator